MHIPQHELEALMLGKLNDADLARVQAHLDECPACSRRLEDVDLSQDGVLAVLRRHAARQARSGASRPAAAQASPRPGSSAPGTDNPADDTMAEALAPSIVVGPFTILGELGRGGMGVVHLAHDPRVGRNVALKVIHPRHVHREEARTLIRDEARAAARLDHDNIVTLYEFDDYDGTVACAFEYVPGGTLEERIRSLPLDAVAAANLVATLAEAVQHAHQEQIVHRDLKPANILLAPDGMPKIADFGLAKILDDADAMQRDGRRAGSPKYMAPEQTVRGGPPVGPAADIYALGAILYELLTQRPPFLGATIDEIIGQVQNAEPIPPRQLDPSLDRDVEAICLKCLQKKPEDRYPSAAALAADLRNFLAYRPVSVRRWGPVEHATKFVRRRPAETAITAALALILAVFFAFAAASYRREKQNTEFDRRTAYAVQLQQAANLAAADPAAALQLLGDPQRCPPDLRDFTWRYLQSLCQRRRGLWQNGNEVQVLAVSETGDRFATGDPQGLLRLWSADQQQPRWEVPAHRGPINDIRFTPDNQRIIAAGEDGTLSFWPPPGKPAEPAWNPAAGPINGLAVSPDGTRLATAHRTGQVRVWDFPGKHPVAELKGHRQSVFRAAFSADGHYLASGSKDATLRVWRLPDGAELQVPNEDHGYVTDVRFHPRDPNQLATSHNDRTVQQWRISAAGKVELVRRLRGFSQTVSTLAYSRDGAFLAAGSYDRTVRVWNVETGQLATSRSTYIDCVRSIAFDRAGQLFTGTKDGQIERWSLDGSDRTLSIRGHDGPLSGLAFLHGNKAIASSGLDGAVRIWDVEDAAQLAQWQVAGEWVVALACAPDRTQFAWECGGTLYRCRFREPASLAPQELPGLFSARAMACSRAGDRLLVADETGLRAVDLAAGTIPWSRSEAESWRVASSPADDVIAAAGEGDVVWIGSSQTGELASRPAGVDGVRSLCFSADGARLALGGASGRIAIQDAKSGRAELVIDTHAGAVLCLAISPDGKTLAGGGEDGQVRLWDTQAGCECLRLPVAGCVQYLDFSPDGRRLACGTDEGEIRIWRAES